MLYLLSYSLGRNTPQHTYALCSVVRDNYVKTKGKYNISGELRDEYSPLEHLQLEQFVNKSTSNIFTRSYHPS
jgi:hypothetical protein